MGVFLLVYTSMFLLQLIVLGLCTLVTPGVCCWWDPGSEQNRHLCKNLSDGMTRAFPICGSQPNVWGITT